MSFKITKEILAAKNVQTEKSSAWDRSVQEKNEKIEKTVKELHENCRILCSGDEKDLVPAYGWIIPVQKMAYRLEKLNYFYKKYQLKVVFAQVKEKFGTFRGYWEIVPTHSGLSGFIGNTFLKLAGKIKSRVDFKYEKVVDEPVRLVLGWEECSKEDFDERKLMTGMRARYPKIFTEADKNAVSEISGPSKPLVVYFKNENGKYYRSVWRNSVPKIHYEPTRMKRVLKLANGFERAGSFLLSFKGKNSVEKTVMRKAFSEEVSQIVDDCEAECGKRCIKCGCSIGLGGLSHTCVTTGWITYVCEDCARARGGKYYDSDADKWIDPEKK